MLSVRIIDDKREFLRAGGYYSIWRGNEIRVFRNGTYIRLLIRHYQERHPDASEVDARRHIEQRLAGEVIEQARDPHRTAPDRHGFESNLWMLARLFVVHR